MKKTFLLNSQISEVVSRMGHTDTIAISDAGLPVPSGIKRIDLAIRRGLPCFLDVLEAVMSELAVEEIIIASEMRVENKELFSTITAMFEKVKISEISHEDFKAQTKNCKAVIRTGECQAFANIILRSTVVF